MAQLGPGVCVWLNQPKWPKWRLEGARHHYDVDLGTGAVLGKGEI